MTYDLSSKLLARLGVAIAQMEPTELYWDQSSELTPQQINKLLAFPDGLRMVEDEIAELNLHEIIRLDTENAIETLAPYRDAICRELGWQDGELTDDELWQLIHEHDLLFYGNGVKLNTNDLIEYTRPKAVLQLGLSHDYPGGDWYERIKYREVKSVLHLFNINPRAIHKDFPNLPYRNGHEYLLPQDLIDLWDNAPYGGEYVIPIDLSLTDYLDKRDHYQTAVTLHKGTRIWLHDYALGSGSISIPLQADLLVKRSRIPYVFGSDLETAGYGLDEVYGLGGSAWNGQISPVITDQQGRWQLPPIQEYLRNFMYGNVSAAWQQSSYIRAFSNTAGWREPHEQGYLMDWDIKHHLWEDFPSEGRGYLRQVAEKSHSHLVIKITEQVGQVALTRCQLIEDTEQQKIVWYYFHDNTQRTSDAFAFVKKRLLRHHEKYSKQFKATA